MDKLYPMAVRKPLDQKSVVPHRFFKQTFLTTIEALVQFITRTNLLFLILDFQSFFQNG